MKIGARQILLLLVIVPLVLYGQTNGFVGVAGKNIVAPDGTPLHLKGINLGNWLVPEGYMFKFDSASSPRRIEDVLYQLLGAEEANKFWKQFRDAYITKDDIHFIKSSGLNSVRVPFNSRLFVLEEYPDVWRTTGFEMLDRVVQWCKEESLYIVLDMHCAPGGQTGDNIDDSYGYPFLFESPEAERLTIEVWKKIAERYKAETIILGYDLLNEPIPHFYNTKQLNPLLEPLYKRITSAIRAIDMNHLIILGGAQWDGNFKVFGPPFDEKLIYTFHKYWTAPTREVIHEYIEFGNKHNVPIWMGESGENSNEWIDTFRVMLDAHDIGWCFWPYKKMKAASCPITFAQPEDYAEIITFANKPRATFAELRQRRPHMEKVRKALAQVIENCKFKNCTPNAGYLKALGLQ